MPAPPAWVGSTRHSAKLQLTLDDTEVRVVGVPGAIDGADTFGGFKHVSLDNEYAEAFGAASQLPGWFIEGEFDLVAHLAFVSARGDVDLEGSEVAEPSR